MFFLEKESVEAIEQATGCLRDRLLVRLLARTGMRVSELITIERERIDPRTSSIVIQNLKSGTKNRKCPQCTAYVGTRALFCSRCGDRLAPAEKEIRSATRFVYVDGNTLQLAASVTAHQPDSRWLFPSPVDSSRHITRQLVYNIVTTAAKKAGLGYLVHPGSNRNHRVSPHAMRSYFAMRSLSLAPTIEGQVRTQKQLGHAKFDTTLKYLRWSPTDARGREWYEKIAKEL